MSEITNHLFDTIDRQHAGASASTRRTLVKTTAGALGTMGLLGTMTVSRTRPSSRSTRSDATPRDPATRERPSDASRDDGLLKRKRRHG